MGQIRPARRPLLASSRGLGLDEALARLVFLGTPAGAAAVLAALAAAGHDLVLVVSRPDRRRGRGGLVTASPVKAAATALGLEVTDRLDQVLEVEADLGVVVAFGRLIPAGILEHLPMVNLHFSLLPRWRGAAPVERAILAGDAETGVCLMALEEGLDTGPVYDRRRVAVGADETAGELAARLVDLGTEMLVEHLAGGVGSLGPASPQVGQPTYAAKLEPGEMQLDWSRPAVELARVVRLGRAWTTAGGRRLLVRRARVAAPAVTGAGQPGAAEPGAAGQGGGQPGALAGAVVTTGDGALELIEVQPEGRPPMDASAWLRGTRLGPDPVLGR